MLLRVQNLEGRQSFRDVLSGKLLLAADSDVRRLSLDRVHHPLETDLLEVQDDVLHALDHAGDSGEFIVHSLDLDLADGETFQRGQQNAAKGIADGLSVSRLKGPELETADGVGAFEHYDLVGLLKC